MSNGYSPKGTPGSIMHPAPPPSLDAVSCRTHVPFRFESAYERDHWVILVEAALRHVDGYDAIKAADVVSHELRARRKASDL
jgi:hypothetical protein